MEPSATLERERLVAAASEYRNRGYRVLVEPRPDQLPEFLRDFELDLVAYRGDEAVVVEVKNRHSLTQTPWLGELARVLQEREGWKLDLIVVGNGEVAYEEAIPLSEREILERFGQARKLLQEGFVEAAFLVAWSATEGGLRLMAKREEVEGQLSGPLDLIQSLAVADVISSDEYETLKSIFWTRNALIHGYKVKNLTGTIVNRLIEMVSRLLEPQPEP